MPVDQDALKQFDTMSRYYAFETTMYWARSHFFLVANAGLLAFAASRLLEPIRGSSISNDGGVRVWRHPQYILALGSESGPILDREMGGYLHCY